MIKKIILTLMMLLFSAQAWAAVINVPCDIAYEMLKKGNYRFSTNAMKHPHQDKARRAKLIVAQRPFAIIVTCSDSRIVPEIIFDQGLGDLFVIRNAGNDLDEHVLGSIDYAITHLGVNLVVVLGHESCGAVGEAMKGPTGNPEIDSLIESIKPAIESCQKNNRYTLENVVKAHAIQDAQEILADKNLEQYMKKHDVKIVPAYYSIQTGQVDFLKIPE